MSGSSSSWCRETDEKINYTKLCRLLVDGGTQAVRSVFDGIHPPSSLKAILNANKTTLQKLKKPKGRVLNGDQWDKLYPTSGSSPKSEDFDITLLFVLLRNICGLTAPVYEITGSGKRKRDWDKLPHKTENSQEANLVRIKYFRNNTIAHKPDTEINDADFEQHWRDISSALLSLGVSQDDINDLKSDPLGRVDYNQLLHEWYVSDKDIKAQLDDLKSDTTGIRSHTEDIKTDTADIKEKVDELHEAYKQATKSNLINKLCKDEFTGNIKLLGKSYDPNTRLWVLDQVKSHVYSDQPHSCMMLITAGPGMGKSTIAAKICQMYKDLGCLAGCHFFQFSNSSRSNPRLMLQSLARQMCDTIPGLADVLESKLQTNHGKGIDDMNCEELFTVLLEEPCHKLKVKGSFVVVLDAIDECCSKFKHELQGLLKNKLSLLPSWLRFVITTRPPPSFNALQVKNSIFINPTDPENRRDIEIFFKTHLENDENQSMFIEQLVKVSGGLFLVGFFLIDEMQKKRISSPSELMVIFPHGLFSVYEKYFERLRTVLLPYITEEEGFSRMLKAVVASENPIPIKMVYDILGLKNVSEVPHIERKARSDALSQLHSLFPVENDHVGVFHKSIVDYLIAEDKEQDFNTTVGKMSKDSVEKLSDEAEGLQDASEVSDSSNHVENKSEKRDQNKSSNTVTEEPPKDHDFIVHVDEGNKVLANQCYDVLSDIRNGKKDLDKPLELTDSEKYALEFGIEYIIHSCTFSNEKKMEVLMNCFVICSALLYRHFDNEMYSVPFKGNSIHFDVSKELENVMLYGGFQGNLFYYTEIDNFSDGYSHVKTCRFNIPLNFIDCVGFFLQAVKTIGLNVDELSPNPKNLIDKHRLPLLSCNLIAVIPEERFSPLTSVIGLILDNLSMTEVVVLPCKDGMMVVKYKEGLTLIHRYIEDGTPSIKREETFSGLKKMCITPDQRFIVATEVDKKGKIEIIDAISLKPVKKYKSPNVVKSCHVFGDQPWYIVARCYNNKIYVMEGETGEIRTTFDVEKDEEVEAVSSSGHIALNKTWVSIRVRYDALFTDDDGNFLEEMSFGISECPDRHSPTTYRKLFLLNALQPCTRVYFYPRRETPCSCRHVYQFNRDNNYDFYQKIVFSHDGKLLAYRYQESVFIVRSEDGSLFERVFVYHLGQRMFDIIHLSHSDIILRQEKKIFIIDLTKNQTKNQLYLPGDPREVYVVPRQQEEPLAILVKNDNQDVREESSKNYSIFRYVFHNIDL